MSDCNIVKDLMPLVIDGAASEESAKLVEEHTALCEPCAETLTELKAELHAEKQAREREEFEKAARRMNHRRKTRKLLAILLPVLAAVVVLVVGGLEIHRLRTTYEHKNPNDFHVQLAQIPGTDQVVLLFSGVDGTGHGMSYDRTEDTMRFLIRVDQRKLTLPGEEMGQECFMQYMGNCHLVDGHIIEEYRGTRTVTEVVLTDDETERVIYQDGDPIPMASDGLVAYYNAWQSLRYSFAGETEEKFEARRAEVEKLKEFVPEFNAD